MDVAQYVNSNISVNVILLHIVLKNVNKDLYQFIKEIAKYLKFNYLNKVYR